MNNIADRAFLSGGWRSIFLPDPCAPAEDRNQRPGQSLSENLNSRYLGLIYFRRIWSQGNFSRLMNLSEWCIASAGRQFKAFCANAYRGKVRKAGLVSLALRMAEEELRPVPSKGYPHKN
jgi:hypothetical protein